MRLIIFEFKAFEQYQEWIKTDRKVSTRISDLIIEAAKNPFTAVVNLNLLRGI